jgi:hypothetical protein
MGRYIDEILQPGEKVLYSTNQHWMFFLPAIAAWIRGGRVSGAFAHGRRRRGDVGLPGLGRGRWACGLVLDGDDLDRWNTETDVTNMRVVHVRDQHHL